MADMKIGGVERLSYAEIAEGLDSAPSGVEALGALANEALKEFGAPELLSPREQWLSDALARAKPNDLMRTAAVLDVVADRIEGDDGARVRKMQQVVQKYAQLEAVIAIRTAARKA